MKKLLEFRLLRRFIVICFHALLWSSSFLAAFALRFDGVVPQEYWLVITRSLPILILLRGLAFYFSGLFHGLWRYAGMPELKNILRATSLSSAALLIIGTMVPILAIPRSVYVGEWLASVVAIGGARFAIRLFAEQQTNVPNPNAIRTIIVGAGDLGESLLRDVQRTTHSKWEVCGFLDDNIVKHGALVRGVKVWGAPNETTISNVLVQTDAKLVVLAIPDVLGTKTREIVNLCKRKGVQVKTVPKLTDRMESSFSEMREVAIEDLLRREPVQLNTDQLYDFLKGQTVLVTGGGGSIGSELARQVLRFDPEKLILFDHDENSLFHIERELREQFSTATIIPAIGDITDQVRVDSVFRRYRPAVVLHAAAHKHVPMMEANPIEAIKNNIFGTLIVTNSAATFGASSFVMISTDKAVNPTSIMGTTKRIAEMIIQWKARSSATHFVAVRFGNVLGSAGSVVPLFREQIARGGPVTVTHPDMRRYFMTIPEAAQLVLQAGSFGMGGEIFVLDMGEPVKIVDLAKDMIELSGHRPDIDIAIQFTGLRPGEKLFEELSLHNEQFEKTQHAKIAIGRIQRAGIELLDKELGHLELAVTREDEAAARRTLSKMVPEATILPIEKSEPSKPLIAIQPEIIPSA